MIYEKLKYAWDPWRNYRGIIIFLWKTKKSMKNQISHKNLLVTFSLKEIHTNLWLNIVVIL